MESLKKYGYTVTHYPPDEETIELCKSLGRYRSPDEMYEAGVRLMAEEVLRREGRMKNFPTSFSFITMPPEKVGAA